MRDLNWIIASNGPEPPPPVSDRRTRAWLGYYGALLARECMTLDPVALRDVLNNIIRLSKEVSK
jgi:hypothetical protein